MDKKYIDYSYTDYQEIVKKDNNYVSSYAENFASQHSNRISEDFADGVAFYLIDERKFTKKYPNRAKYFKELLRKIILGGNMIVNNEIIEKKIKEILDRNNNFRDLTFNVPTKAEQDFITYMAYKMLLKEK